MSGSDGWCGCHLLDENIGKAKAIMHAAEQFPDFDWF